MIYPDAMNQRKEALYLMTNCHLQLHEQQHSLKYVTKSIDQLDDRVVKTGMDIINTLISEQIQLSDELYTIQQEYIKKVQNIKTDLSIEMKEKSFPINVIVYTKKMKEYKEQMKKYYFNEMKQFITNDVTISLENNYTEIFNWIKSLDLNDLNNLKQAIEMSYKKDSLSIEYEIMDQSILITLLELAFENKENNQLNCLLVFVSFMNLLILKTDRYLVKDKQTKQRMIHYTLDCIKLIKSLQYHSSFIDIDRIENVLSTKLKEVNEISIENNVIVDEWWNEFNLDKPTANQGTDSSFELLPPLDFDLSLSA